MAAGSEAGAWRRQSWAVVVTSEGMKGWQREQCGVVASADFFSSSFYLFINFDSYNLILRFNRIGLGFNFDWAQKI